MTDATPIPQFLARILARIYATRPCFICGKAQWCGHREPRVDIAEFIRDYDAYVPPPKETPCSPNAPK